YLGWNALAPEAYAEDRRRRGCDDGCDEGPDEIRNLQRTRPHPVLADPRVRRALALAIDRQDIVDGLWDAHARVGTTPIVSASWAHSDGGALPFDQAAA
ncbi:MAG: hypothetical protein GWO02_17370, partial [Gammaproteobacteria bacterium]|nr:hypothetical protein [Gammaproteobacteria bacterium]